MTEHDFEPYTKEILIVRLSNLRDKWSEEVPHHILHSTDGPYKIRTGWFLGLVADLEVSKIESVLPNEVIEDVDKFLKWWKDDFGKRPGSPVINTKDDIEKGNLIINKVLESLGVSPKTGNA